MIKKLFLIAFALSAAACTQIDTGNVGVERSLGKVREEPLPQGIYQTITKTVDEFTTKEFLVAVRDLKPKSQDNLTMADVDVDIYVRTNPQAVPALVIKYQGDVVEYGSTVEGKDRVPGGSDLIAGYGRLSREARETVYKVVSTFEATTMHTKRDEIAAAVVRELQAQLDASDKGAFVITSANVRNLMTDPAIEKAIRARAETDQQIERKRKEIELAKAEAERLSVEARGTAEANEIISRSLTPQLVRIREIEAQRDAAIAIAGKAGNTVLLGSGATPLVSVGK